MSTVLLVFDDPETPWALHRALPAEGHHVVFAVNGHDALQKARLQHPQLVITDWNMPQMDGIELCCRLKLLAVSRLIARRLSVRHVSRRGEEVLTVRGRAVDSRCWP
ncbi:response regulator [Paraburkholderia fungorum]|uniref:response regulator n=1 Tax=Paraburkholderia fungorum TaxID=134537 RepID=UPI001C1ECDEF|nr:response regulator [Paraburkholderia fungorum]MBU7443508.1 response regulator [Paraburkholderia fungorum]